MNVRELRMSDAYQGGGNKFVIDKGLRTIQLTLVELLELQAKLNDFILYNINNSLLPCKLQKCKIDNIEAIKFCDFCKFNLLNK